MRIFEALFMAAALLLPAFIIYLNITPLLKLTKKSKAARAKLNMVNAVLLKEGPDVYYVHGETTPYPRSQGVYHYFYNGKKYKYRGWFIGRPPKQLTLYVLNNPKKATPNPDEATTPKVPWLKIYLIVFGILLFLTS